MSHEPDYVVIRAAPDLPPGFLPADLDGKWFDRSQLRLGLTVDTARLGGAVAVPSGRFETNDAGQVAEVWEVRP